MDPDPAQITSPTNGAVNDLNRPPRLPRWTRQEILVLIQGKRVAETRVRRGGPRAHQLGGAHHQVEPKWASVASYCRRHGVSRGPVQCRKRWSNLAGDYRKIKEWEAQISDGSESFWVMRNDARRERRLPGFFDREVYEVLEGGDAAAEAAVAGAGEEEVGLDGLNSDFDPSKEEEEAAESMEKEAEVEAGMPVSAETAERPEMEAEVAVPVSEKKYQPVYQEYLNPGTPNEQQPALNPEKGSTSRDGKKRKRVSPEGGGVTNLQGQLIEIVEQNSRMMKTQFEAMNINCQLDRDQRKDHTESLIGVLSRLADALGRIADKL
ncbi:trihelix transcription factor ASR3-like protein [Cinnamomum micranthum f. kanehirae]|uniref:Trihelix transcription factor ASR3-like protein n=1 Tax=Cinnamomum micranthum f. kanehirae TaxID=337451 RepID=A0A3S3NUQ8_9MAGN|nr:trihelix transcription factor ASR3-like protein [Cinnamomum micranthum f. kanehirae]